MVMSASTNTSANTALRYLSQNSAASASSLAKLSSGSRIVRASDDAASLAVGTKLRADVTALKQASVNASQASSVLQVADGALAQTVEILMRMKALSVQAQSGSVSDNERGFLQMEFQALSRQIDSIAEQTKFNSDILLQGAFAGDIPSLDAAGTNLDGIAGTDATSIRLNANAQAGEYQIDVDRENNIITLQKDVAGEFTTQEVDVTGLVNAGDQLQATVAFTDFGIAIDFNLGDFNSDGSNNIAFNTDTQFTVEVTEGQSMSFQVGVAASDTIDINLSASTTAALGIQTAQIGTAGQAVAAGGMLDAAIAQLNEYRSDVGAQISRFEFASANLATTIENLDASRSVLLDVDMAAEMSNFSSKQVLLQASVAMLAQANQQPQQLLKLLG